METFDEKVMITYKEKVAAYQRVFSGEDGKIVLDDLLNFCGVGRPSGTPTLSNAISTALSMLILSNSPGLSAAKGSNVLIT
jgi:hypothetical protein